MRILALTDAEKMRIQAEAAASNDQVALDRMLIDQLPETTLQPSTTTTGRATAATVGQRGDDKASADSDRRNMM